MIKRLLLAAYRGVLKVISGKGFGKIPLIKKIHASLLQKLRPEDVEIQGHKLYINPRDVGVMTSQLLTKGVYEKKMTELFQKIVKKGMIVVDIGANIGYYTLISAMHVGEEGKVIAFEPDPENHAFLIKTINKNGYKNVIAIQKAVSNESGEVSLFLDQNSKANNSLIRANVPNPSGSIIIEAVTLDEELKKLGIDRVDIIKIDSQGAEDLILQGMSEIINKSFKLKIIAEFWPTGLKNFGSNPADVFNKLKKYGFHCTVIDDQKQSIEPIILDELLLRYRDKGHTNLLFERSQ